jgi:serine/threonine protein kinase
MGSKALVERFRQKFVKEAQTISEFSHPHIIRIYDVFEENGTAYYVMEYHSSGSLSDLVKHRGKLEERESISYIRQIAEALRYIHERNINHLDVKPENVLLNNDGHIVLIDFGMSKRYDADGEQTSTTPVGISHGYAPLEQYKKGGVGTFSPVTDIYSLGATFYKLVTGITPPDASEVDEDGLSSFPGHISDEVKLTIWRSMSMKRKDRPQNVDGFLSLLNAPIKIEDEDTVIDDITSVFPNSESFGVHNKWFIFFVFCLITALCVLGLRGCRRNVGDKNNVFCLQILWYLWIQFLLLLFQLKNLFYLLKKNLLFPLLVYFM